jgi:hypothetical protein
MGNLVDPDGALFMTEMASYFAITVSNLLKKIFVGSIEGFCFIG